MIRIMLNCVHPYVVINEFPHRGRADAAAVAPLSLDEAASRVASVGLSRNIR
jgi:hypothetical protein